MKWWIKVLFLTVCLQLVKTKSLEKTYRKKVTSSTLKPTKTPKSSIDELSTLPADDLEFIKELDKQFKLHGDKIKIKVERDNTTVKNPKRTIDGSLGYGYQQAHLPKYQFSKPRYMLYPYSQNHIPPHTRYIPGTSVQIQPSQAYEIKQTSGGYQTYTPNHQQYIPQYSKPSSYLPYQQLPIQHYHQRPQQYIEPVIVLRIPGPQKYAAHLQALLQRYLEIRAAQYLKILQEQEGQQHHNTNDEGNYTPQYQHHHSGSNIGQSKPNLFQPINQIYESVHYSNNNSPQSNYQHSQVNYETSDETNDNDENEHGNEQSYSYNTETQTESASYHQHGSSYNYETPYYKHSSHSSYNSPSSSSNEGHNYDYDKHDTNIPISENYPSHTHTTVNFVKGANNDDHSTNYQLPTITTPRYHIGSTPEDYQQNFAASVTTSRYENPSSTPTPSHIRYHYEQQHHDEDENGGGEEETQEEDEVVSITQKPFNYHAHSPSSQIRSSLDGYKRPAIPYSQQQFEKLNQLLSRLKSNNYAVPTDGHRE